MHSSLVSVIQRYIVPDHSAPIKLNDQLRVLALVILLFHYYFLDVTVM